MTVEVPSVLLDKKWGRSESFVLWNGYELCAECGEVMVNGDVVYRTDTSPNVFYYAHPGKCRATLIKKENEQERRLRAAQGFYEQV